MNIIELLEEAGYTPKRKASTHGGEYCSPCPFCKDGDDRFLIWPNRANKNGETQGGRFSCRVCGNYGDAITFLSKLHGLSYREACARLKIAPKQRNKTQTPPLPPKLIIAEDPPELWQQKATAFIEWSHANLIRNPEMLAYVMKRGFTLEAIKLFKIGFNPGHGDYGYQSDFLREREEWGLTPETKDDGKPRKLWLPIGITIPTFQNGKLIKVKIRRSAWREGGNNKFPKYVEVSGSKQCPSLYGNTSLPIAVIIESELDGLLIQQFVSDMIYCVSLGGSTKPLDFHTDQHLRKTPILLFCPDFDPAGKKAWDKWNKMFPGIHRLLTPNGKGAGDAYIEGVDLREWLIAGIETAKREKLKCQREI